jgi:dipeptidyl aminopeptidase/acylaminoacyl peptidase
MVVMPVVYRLPGMETVRVVRDLKYSDVDNPHLLMDVYLPGESSGSGRHPVVFLIHGGAAPEYRAKDWGVFQSWGRLVAASGMIGIAFTHRLGYPVPFLDEASADLANAVAYVRANGDLWNADGESVGLMAFSAGGPLLASGSKEDATFVRCLIAFYAFLEMEPPTIPLFVARAGLDAVPGLKQGTDRFIAAALAANAPVTAVNHPAGEHGFDMLNDDGRSREIIRGALEFMKTHLGT